MYYGDIKTLVQQYKSRNNDEKASEMQFISKENEQQTQQISDEIRWCNSIYKNSEQQYYLKHII